MENQDPERAPGAQHVAGAVMRQWGLTEALFLSRRASTTWRAARGPETVVVKLLPPWAGDWRYQAEVADRFWDQGWPVPRLLTEPVISPEGTWLLLSWLPGTHDGIADQNSERLFRGRLLAELHAAALETGITRQRPGFSFPLEIARDPALIHWLDVHAQASPGEAAVLSARRAAAAAWLAGHDLSAAPVSVIHGDFVPWNLLYTGRRVSGVLDLEAAHLNYQVSDFALAWRGDRDDVIRGYCEVRALTDLEWDMLLPCYWSWLLMGVAELLERHYRHGSELDLSWQLNHLQRHSPLVRDHISDAALQDMICQFPGS
jgi:Ser/Thr protein kinase RdoA (MazF antagonist)